MQERYDSTLKQIHSGIAKVVARVRSACQWNTVQPNNLLHGDQKLEKKNDSISAVMEHTGMVWMSWELEISTWGQLNTKNQMSGSAIITSLQTIITSWKVSYGKILLE